MILWICQLVFGIAALAAAGRAAWSVAQNERRGSYYLMLAGAFALVFFLTVPEIMPEMIALAVLAIAAGALLMPMETRRSVRDLLDDDIEVGDSTASRRLKR